jgi:hypothetical protein
MGRRDDEEAAAAAAEAAAIGGRARDFSIPTPEGLEADEAMRPVLEAGEGDAEGFELAELELEAHASHDHDGGPINAELDASRVPEDPRAAQGGEADGLRSTEREDDDA